jgi:hypothetical protein
MARFSPGNVKADGKNSMRISALVKTRLYTRRSNKVPTYWLSLFRDIPILIEEDADGSAILTGCVERNKLST